MRALGLLAVLAGGGSCENEPLPGEGSIVPDDYASFPEVRACRFSVEHDAVNIRVLADPESQAAYVDGVYPFEAGALLVKLEYRDGQCSDLVGFTAMQRLQDGQDEELDDWVWQRLDAERNPVDVDPMTCVACHRGCTEGRDLACTNP